MNEPATGWLFRPGEALPLQVTAQGARFSLAELRTIVGGHIEAVPVRYAGRWSYLIVNDRGKLEGLRFNQAATEAFSEFLAGDWIAGHALVVERGALG